MSKKLTTEEFIKKTREIHGNKYDYSKTEYRGSHTLVCIICPEHGEFWQSPHKHLSGQGCPKCGKIKQTESLKIKVNDFIRKSKKIHRNKYNYEDVVYVNNNTKVEIKCPIHGIFWQTPSNHMSGKGCPICGKITNGIKHSLNKENFIKKALEVHKAKYNYKDIEFTNATNKICITCPIHGDFWQYPYKHLLEQGCPECGKLNQIAKTTCSLAEFIEKANKIHKGKYFYTKAKYVNSKTNISIICPEHGEFQQTPDSHIQGQGCPKCAKQTSKPEEEIIELLQTCNPQQRNRLLLKGKEIDIYLRDLKLGIEYNGLRWHSEELGKDRSYHLDKLNECNKQGIRLIQIFEDEWVNHKDICISKLKQICGLNNNPKIYARKCVIREIKNKKEVYDFLDKNHIQGQTGCTLALGAYYGEQLVAVMCFKKEKEGFWDLNRFASDINYQCIGLGGKLFKYFTDNYPYQEVKSFADRRWTTNPKDNLYTKLGFDFDSFVEPTYWYYNPKVEQYKRFHKFGFRKQPLHRQYGLPLTMTEREMTTALGYTRIWDCGLIKYVYR